MNRKQIASTWPLRADGTQKTMREMTREEQDREVGKAVDMLAREFRQAGWTIEHSVVRGEK